MQGLITFEGIEGSGKSTQIKLASDYLLQNKIPLFVTSEPSGTDIGRKIGGILFEPSHNYMCAETELFLFCAARAQHVREEIIPALNANKLVLCDRFSDATYAYQGFGRGLNKEIIKTINDYSSLNLKPDLTLLFDLPAETGLKRAIQRNNSFNTADRFDKENIAFHKRVREGYLNICKSEPERFRLIDATPAMDIIQKEVLAHIMDFIDKRK